jgi:hypothetical protein
MTQRPTFEHRHFAWLADWARHSLPEDKRRELARDLRRTNSRFDEERFLAAAGASNRPMNGRDRVR